MEKWLNLWFHEMVTRVPSVVKPEAKDISCDVPRVTETVSQFQLVLASPHVPKGDTP